MKVSIDAAKNELVIRIPMQEPELSSSGKTLTVATSHGFKETSADINGRKIKVNLHALINQNR